MTDQIEMIEAVSTELRSRTSPSSIEELVELLNPLSIGLKHHGFTLPIDTRMFRVTKCAEKPDLLEKAGAPPKGAPRSGRLNEAGQSVLYLADSPATAFAEVSATSGEFCLSEWRTTAPNLSLAHGGISADKLAELF